MNFNKSQAFSLIEVVVAVGIFAVSIVGVIGLMIPTSQAVVEVRESDEAYRVIDSIRSELQRLAISGKFMDIGTTYLKAPGDVSATTAVNTAGLFASKNGAKVALGADAVWQGSNTDKFYEAILIRNTDLSRAADDATSGYLAFFVQLRWPAYLPDGTLVSDLTQKSTLLVPMAITR